MGCYINFQMSKKKGDIDEWLLLSSSDVSDDGGPEGDFDADELAFDRVFWQELETRLVSQEQLNDIPNIVMQETELSEENYDDNLEVENEEDLTVQTMKTLTMKWSFLMRRNCKK